MGDVRGGVPASHSARQWAKGLQNDQRNRAPQTRRTTRSENETGFLARLSIGFPRSTTLPTTENALGWGGGCRHSLLRRATRFCCPRSLLQGKVGVFIPHPQGRRGRPGAKASDTGIGQRVEGVAVGGLLIAGSSADHGGQRSRVSGLGGREAMSAVIYARLSRVLSFANVVDQSRSLPSSTGSVRRDLCSLSWCAWRGIKDTKTAEIYTL